MHMLRRSADRGDRPGQPRGVRGLSVPLDRPGHPPGPFRGLVIRARPGYESRRTSHGSETHGRLRSRSLSAELQEGGPLGHRLGPHPGDDPAARGEARCLAYMMDIESHTVIFLRDLLATRAAYEPDVTAFLSCWVYEELWHGEAFSRFLGEAGSSWLPTANRCGATPRTRAGTRATPWIRRKLGARATSHLATLVGLGGAQGLRGAAHDVGRGERALDAHRLPPADRPDQAPGPDRAPPAHHQGRAAAFRVLPVAGPRAGWRRAARRAP